MNFDKMIDRRNTDSSKWNVKANELPLGLADMDFQVAPAIVESIKRKAEYGVLGYTDIPQRYYESYKKWWIENHGFNIDIGWMVFSTGVVPAISSIVRKLTSPAENILILAPVYNIFYNSILNNGRNVLSCDLCYQNGEYVIDFKDLEVKLSNSQTTMMILCNPHNPIGKIWDKETLSRIGSLCAKYNVIVVSDEIHCDIVHPDYAYIPFASVNEECANLSITCLSVSKAFNMAGLQSACIVIPNDYLRNKVIRGLNTDEVAEPNVFAVNATIAALEESKDWLVQVNQYIQMNKEIVEHFINENIPELYVVPSQATYLMWIDCSYFTLDTEVMCFFLRNETGLCLTSGAIFGKSGASFIRMNIACPKERILDALSRLKEGLYKFDEEYVNAC